MRDNVRGLAQKYKLFVFDWDGTLLYLRLPLAVNEAIKRALRLWNVSAPKKLVDMRKSYKSGAMSEEKMKNHALVFVTDLIFMLSKPRLHNDTMKVLEALRKQHKQVALFSNAGRYRLTKELEYLGIKDYFKVVVSARDFHTTKPDPAGLKAILNTMNIAPGDAIYFGDMVDDIISAKLAKVASCAVADGFDSHHKLKSVEPDYIFDGIEGLKAAL